MIPSVLSSNLVILFLVISNLLLEPSLEFLILMILISQSSLFSSLSDHFTILF